MLRNNVKGFSLVEVLVALVVVSVGMLGVAGLYVNGLQAGRTAMFSHQAVTLAGDVADRIRANPRAGVAYDGNGDGVNHNCVAGGVDCDAAQMAATDTFFWQQQAAAALPNGRVDVQLDAGVDPPEYTINVSWDEPGERRDYEFMIPVWDSEL